MVSIIVSTYEQSRILRWLLVSLEKQDYPGELEVLVCDDGSSDRTPAVVSEAAERGVLDLRLIWQPHQGYRLPRSRNNGVRSARGEILLFVDGDCIVPRNWVSTHVRAHRGPRAKPRIVGGTRSWVDFDWVRRNPRDLETLIRFCKRNAARPDTERQEQLARSRSPWASCWGFNFSVPKTPEIVFDEGLIGWGNDDFELFCRLFHRHGYRATLRKDLDVFHFSLPKLGSGWNPWVSGKPEHIAGYIRSIVHLASRYPEVDLSEALWPLHFFRLDAKTGKWRKARPGEKISLPRALITAEIWAEQAGTG